MEDVSDAELLSLIESHEQGDSSSSSSSSTLHSRRPPPQQQQIACLYTHQKTKRKKAFQDGVLRLVERNCSVSLFKASSGTAAMGGALDSRILSRNEVDALKSGELPEIEFEGFLVEIDQFVEKAKNNENSCNSSSNNRGAGCMQPPLLKKFKVPSRIAPREPMPSGDSQSGTNTGHGGSNSSSSGGGGGGAFGKRSAYTIEDDELDDIWGTKRQGSEVKRELNDDDDNDAKNINEDSHPHITKKRQDIWNESLDDEENSAESIDGYIKGYSYGYDYGHDAYERKTSPQPNVVSVNCTSASAEGTTTTTTTTATVPVNIWGDSDSD